MGRYVTVNLMIENGIQIIFYMYSAIYFERLNVVVYYLCKLPLFYPFYHYTDYIYIQKGG